MAGIVEIPLSPEAQRFSIALDGTVYKMRVTYCEAGDGAWILDIGTQAGAILVAGIPLVTGVNLLSQYKYLGIVSLYVTTDRGAGETPTYDGLGVTSHLYFVPAA